MMKSLRKKEKANAYWPASGVGIYSSGSDSSGSPETDTSVSSMPDTPLSGTIAVGNVAIALTDGFDVGFLSGPGLVPVHPTTSMQEIISINVIMAFRFMV